MSFLDMDNEEERKWIERGIKEASSRYEDHFRRHNVTGEELDPFRENVSGSALQYFFVFEQCIGWNEADIAVKASITW